MRYSGWKAGCAPCIDGAMRLGGGLTHDMYMFPRVSEIGTEPLGPDSPDTHDDALIIGIRTRDKIPTGNVHCKSGLIREFVTLTYLVQYQHVPRHHPKAPIQAP